MSPAVSHGTVQATAGERRAAHYAGAACRTARASQLARLPTWQRVGGSYSAVASISHELRAVYVPNPKAASSFLRGVLKIGFGAQYLLLRRSPRSRRAVWNENADCENLPLADCVPQGYTVFTFVREPLAATISGFGETCRMETARRDGEKSLSPSLAIPCTDVGARFHAFVGELARGENISRYAYHAWPQVAKLAYAGDHALDFIGSFESLCDDLQALLRRLGVAPAKVRAVGSVCSGSSYGGGAAAFTDRGPSRAASKQHRAASRANASLGAWHARLASSLAFATRSATARQQLGACVDHVHWPNGSMLQPDGATTAMLREVMGSDLICFPQA